MYLFLISLCRFKGMINAFGGLFVLTSGILIYRLPNKKEFFKKYKLEIIFVVIYLLGVILECFSIENAKAYKFLYKNFYFLMTLGLLYFFEKEEFRKRAVYLICFSLLIGIAESFRQFAVIYKYNYNSNIRVESFFDIMRMGFSSSNGTTFNIAFFKEKYLFLDSFFIRNPKFNTK